jgi:hypothetical protein
MGSFQRFLAAATEEAVARRRSMTVLGVVALAAFFAIGLALQFWAVSLFTRYVPVAVQAVVAIGGSILLASTWKISTDVVWPALKRFHEQEPSLEERIKSATVTLRDVAATVDEVKAEVELRLAALERTRAEHDQFEQLTAMKAKEAEAVTRLVESVISATHVKMGRANLRSQMLYFALGVATSIPIGVMVNLWTK